MKTALSYLSCDRPELIAQTLPPLVASAVEHRFHLFIVDGSKTKAGEDAVFSHGYPTARIHSNVNGGAGAAIVYALTEMLKHHMNYDVVGLCEADVLLGPNWFDRCADMLEAASNDGLEVGAFSARAYEDRILFQRDGYAVMHNIGAGHILFTRKAAEIVLKTFRTGWSSDNRRIFGKLAGIDIGTYWAFRTNEHYLTADWCWDAHLAAHGLASVALTPSPVEMVGQDPPLNQQGLTIVKEPVLATNPPTPRTLDVLFDRYRIDLKEILIGEYSLGIQTQFHFNSDNGTWTYFPHQMHMLGGRYEGDWHLKEARGWGTFAWKAGDPVEFVNRGHGDVGEIYTSLTVPVFGSCAVLVSGGATGGKVEVVDEHSGFKADPELPPEDKGILQLMVPGGMTSRTLRITALTPGCVFYGIQTREQQPFDPSATFDYSNLPPV